jgi:hypothetical protein
MVPQVKTLASLYLEATPIEISATLQQELCDWLMAFQQLPIDPEFFNDMRYRDAAELYFRHRLGASVGFSQSLRWRALPKPVLCICFLSHS